MTFAEKTHWIGVFFLFVSSILLLVTTISAPIINDIGLLEVTLPNGTSTHHSRISFGTFGYCVLNAADPNDSGAYCSKVHIGYSPAHIVAAADDTSFYQISAGTSDALTNVMVLHPIACVVAFIAFLLSCGAGILGSLAGALTAFVALIITLIALAVDFSIFGILHHHINDDTTGHANFGSAIWCVLAAFVALFLGMVIVFFTCCAKRREKKKNAEATRKQQEFDNQAPRRKKRFGLF